MKLNNCECFGGGVNEAIEITSLNLEIYSGIISNETDLSYVLSFTVQKHVEGMMETKPLVLLFDTEIFNNQILL